MVQVVHVVVPDVAGEPVHERVHVEVASEGSKDEQLVAYLLENWELVMSEDVDVFLGSIDPADVAFLELQGGSEEF